MRSRRLLWQLLFAYFCVTLAVVLLISGYAAVEVHRLYKEQTAASLEAEAWACATRIAELIEPAKSADLQTLVKDMSASSKMRITVVLPSGKVVADNAESAERMDNHEDRPEIIDARQGRTGRSIRYSATLQETLMYVAVPVPHAGRTVAIVRTAITITTLAERLRSAYLGIALAGLIAAVAAVAVSSWASRRIIRPLDDIRHSAERFARGDLQHRLSPTGCEEIAMLARSLNHMAEQLDQRIHTVLRQQNEHEAVLSSMEEGVLAIDPNGTILSINDACAGLLGGEAGKLRGRTIYEALRKPALLEFAEAMLDRSAPLDGDLRFAGREERWLNAHGTVLHDAHERKIGVLIVLHDVTRLRQLENMRRDFVANVSHELRTPITSIKGFVETLADEGLENREDSLRFLDIVLKQVNRLNAIITDLLMLSRVERGAEDQTIATEPEPVADVLRAAVEMCERKAADKGVTISVTCADDLVAPMNAPLLEQAVTNLIDNAIKYSDPGATVQIEGDRDSRGVVIRVRDQGCGIAAQHLPHLFERFYRVDKTRSRELGGTGLGLAIVKHIVMAHHGSTQVDSGVGRGSTFSIFLPAASASSPGLATPKHA